MPRALVIVLLVVTPLVANPSLAWASTFVVKFQEDAVEGDSEAKANVKLASAEAHAKGADFLVVVGKDVVADGGAGAAKRSRDPKVRKRMQWVVSQLVGFGVANDIIATRTEGISSEESPEQAAILKTIVEVRVYFGSANAARVVVACSGYGRHTYRSIAAALKNVGEGERILILDSACDGSLSGLTISHGVTIEAANDVDENRFSLRADPCVSIAPANESSLVSLRGVDVDGCITVSRGRLDLVEVNVASRREGAGVNVDGGSLNAVDSTIRAQGTAIRAVGGRVVSLTRGGFASGPHATEVLRLTSDSVVLHGPLLVSGGQVGMRIETAGGQRVELNDVRVLRGDPREMLRFGPGRSGILLEGPMAHGSQKSPFSVKGGSVAGFYDGLVLAGQLRGIVEGISVGHSGRGIVVGPGVVVELKRNRVTHSKRVGIDLADGARGSASDNDIQRDSGGCVCYAGQCTSLSDGEFGRGAFRMSGTRCR